MVDKCSQKYCEALMNCSLGLSFKNILMDLNCFSCKLVQIQEKHHRFHVEGV